MPYRKLECQKETEKGVSVVMVRAERVAAVPAMPLHFSSGFFAHAPTCPGSANVASQGVGVKVFCN